MALSSGPLAPLVPRMPPLAPPTARSTPNSTGTAIADLDQHVASNTSRRRPPAFGRCAGRTVACSGRGRSRVAGGAAAAVARQGGGRTSGRHRSRSRGTAA